MDLHPPSPGSKRVPQGCSEACGVPPVRCPCAAGSNYPLNARSPRQPKMGSRSTTALPSAMCPSRLVLPARCRNVWKVACRVRPRSAHRHAACVSGRLLWLLGNSAVSCSSIYDISVTPAVWPEFLSIVNLLIVRVTSGRCGCPSTIRVISTRRHPFEPDPLVLPQLKLEFLTQAECNPAGRRDPWGQGEHGDIDSTARRTKWRY